MCFGPSWTRVKRKIHTRAQHRQNFYSKATKAAKIIETISRFMALVALTVNFMGSLCAFVSLPVLGCGSVAL
jgi:hypothetical protein